jgi:hypothetical protein
MIETLTSSETSILTRAIRRNISEYGILLIDHVVIGRRRHSSVLDVGSFKAADCDTEHSVVVAKNRAILAENKQESNKFHMERFSLKKLNEVEVKRSIVLRSQIGLQVLKILMLRWELILSGKRLEII